MLSSFVLGMWFGMGGLGLRLRGAMECSRRIFLRSALVAAASGAVGCVDGERYTDEDMARLEAQRDVSASNRAVARLVSVAIGATADWRSCPGSRSTGGPTALHGGRPAAGVRRHAHLGISLLLAPRSTYRHAPNGFATSSIVTRRIPAVSSISTST